jgi:hypothetical protein
MSDKPAKPRAAQPGASMPPAWEAKPGAGDTPADRAAFATTPGAPDPSPPPAPAAQPKPGTPPSSAAPASPKRSDEPMAAVAQRGGGGAGIALGALTLLVLAVLASPFWAPAVSPLLPWGPRETRGTATAPPSDLAERVAKLEQRGAPPTGVPQEIVGRLDRLEQQIAQPRPAALPPELAERLQRVEQQIAQPRPAAELPQDVAERLKRIEERVAAPPRELLDRIAQLEQRPAADPNAARAAAAEARRLAGTVQALEQRLAAVDQRERAEATVDRTDQALLVALTQLRQAVGTARPYGSELGAVTALARERPEITGAVAPLQANAAKGVPTLTLLTQQFAAAANEIVRADRAPPSDSFGDQVVAKLSSLVSVRRVGKGAVEQGAEAAVAAAEQALAEGDLGAAVAALETLQGPAAEAAKPWLDQARARLAAEAAVSKANGLALARVAQGGAPPK